MLTYFIVHVFATLFGAAIGDAPIPAAPPVVQMETIETDRVAQVRLAEVLGTADGIHAVTANGRKVTFVINRGEQVYRVVATTTRKGEVTTLEIVPIVNDLELSGGLTWLADELEAVTAVTRLVADDDGAVTITTNDNRRYMAIPGRGSGGNTGVEARWAAEWDRNKKG
jgi:hypothetical protein